MGAAARLRLALLLAAAAAWRVCDVADHGAVGDGQTDDSRALRQALSGPAVAEAAVAARTPFLAARPGAFAA